jgi:hypothetical protein
MSSFLFLLSFVFLFSFFFCVLSQQVDPSPFSFLYSDNVDLRISLEMVEGVQIGERFLPYEGFATACYAHQRYKELPLHEAIKYYVKNRNDQLIRDKEKPAAAPKLIWPPDYIKKYEEIRIVDWDSDRDGVKICTVGSTSAYSFNEEDEFFYVVDVDFKVSSVSEARNVVSEIIRKVNRMRPSVNIGGLHFSGTLVFVSKVL